MAHLSSQNLVQGPTSHDRNFRRLRLQKQSLTTHPWGCRVHHAARATRHWELAATQWTEFHGNHESSTFWRESSARLPAGPRPHRHWCLCWSTWSEQGDGGDIQPQCFQMLSKKQPWQWPLTFEKKKRRVYPTWPNIATKFAKRGTQKSLLLLNWSSWRRAASATQWTEFESNHESSTFWGESSARLPAGPRPHRHWCLCWSTWSDQGDGGDIQPQCFQMLSKKQPWQWPLTFEKKTRRLSKLAKHRNEVCKTRHSENSASFKLVQLAPRSFCHAADGILEAPWKYNFSRGEFRKTSSRSAAPSALVSSTKHLECSKGHGGDKRMAICCRSSCKWLL